MQSHRHYPEIAAGLVAAGGQGRLRLGAQRPGRRVVRRSRRRRSRSSRTSCRCSGASARPSTSRPARCRCRPPRDVKALYEEFYAGETFVEVCDAPPALKDVAGTNYCRIFPHVDERAGRIVVISVIDNLMKGASGQAVQNMNVMLGLPEHEGLV